MANQKIFSSLHHAIKACGGPVSKLHTFLTSALKKGEWRVPRFIFTDADRAAISQI
jgi:hypothetical protein